MAVPNVIKVNYQLTVYKNTGFNGFDIPATPAVLEEADKVVYNDTYYLREDFDKPVINVNDNYHNLSDVDYVKLKANKATNNQPTEIYYFCSPRPLAGGTTALALELDALMTLGGAPNIEYTSGIQTRGHISKEEDVMFGNVASEDWVPRQILETVRTDIIDVGRHSGDYLNVILSTTDLITIGADPTIIDTIKGMVAAGQSPVMYIPKIKSNTDATNFKINPENSVNDYKTLVIPNTVAYDADKQKVKDGMGVLFSCGQLQLQNSYAIPTEYIEETTENADGKITEIKGGAIQHPIGFFNFKYGIPNYTIKNNKCFATYRMMSIYNVASGGVISKPVSELKYKDWEMPVVRIWADPVSTGKPYARFITDIAPDIPYVDTVEGAQWCNSQIVLEGASGSLWNSLNASFSQQNYDRELQMAHYNNEYSKYQQETQMGIVDRSQQANEFRSALNIGGGLLHATGMMMVGNGTAAINDLGSLAMQGYDLGIMAQNNADNLAMMNKQLENIDKQLAFGEDRLRQQMNENKIGELKNNNVVAPTNLFTPNPNTAMYGYNRFYIAETRKTNEDLKSEDLYYQMFGYNGLNKKLTKDCFKVRQYYNFVQAYNINIKSNKSTSMRLKMKAINQLNSGVRVWNVLPDSSYYEIN